MTSALIEPINTPPKLANRRDELERKRSELVELHEVASLRVGAGSGGGVTLDKLQKNERDLRDKLSDVNAELADVGNSIRRDIEERRTASAHAIVHSSEYRRRLLVVINAEAKRLQEHAALVQIHTDGLRTGINIQPGLPSTVVGSVHILTEWCRELIRAHIVTPVDLPAWLRDRIEAQP